MKFYVRHLRHICFLLTHTRCFWTIWTIEASSKMDGKQIESKFTSRVENIRSDRKPKVCLVFNENLSSGHFVRYTVHSLFHSFLFIIFLFHFLLVMRKCLSGAKFTISQEVIVLNTEIIGAMKALASVLYWKIHLPMKANCI